HQKFGGHIFQKCLPLCVISPSAVLIHQSIFDDVGLFDESLPACEDYDLWLRVCSKYPVLFLEQKLIRKYGGHSDQLSGKFWGMDRFRIYALEKIIRSEKLSENDQAMAIETLIQKMQIYLAGAKKRNKIDEIKRYEKKLKEFILP
ncbi:glycosyltransferase family 2 protein, partial [bacterium]|nr:glycosyltransferase family 2 protein [bacterium]